MSKSPIDENFISEIAFEIEVWGTYGCCEYPSGFVYYLIKKYDGKFYCIEQVKIWADFLIESVLYNPHRCNLKEIAYDLIDHFELRKTKPNFIERIINFLKGK